LRYAVAKYPPPKRNQHAPRPATRAANVNRLSVFPSVHTSDPLLVSFVFIIGIIIIIINIIIFIVVNNRSPFLSTALDRSALHVFCHPLLWPHPSARTWNSNTAFQRALTPVFRSPECITISSGKH
jgi:hypothetical protein